MQYFVSKSINQTPSSGQAYRWWLIVGCLNAAFAVGLGALGAHAFKGLLEQHQTQQWFNLALLFHQWHALGLVLLGLIARILSKQKTVHVAGLFMSMGILLFCGLLYLRSLGFTGAWHGLIPLGGASFIVGWLLLVAAIWGGARD